MKDGDNITSEEKKVYNDLKLLSCTLEFFEENNVSGECFEYLSEKISELTNIANEEMDKYAEWILDSEVLEDEETV